MSRVLVVEDSQQLRHDILRALELEGIAALGAASGEEALDALHSNNVELVLTELKLPCLNGLQLMKSSRDAGINASFVFLSGFGNIELAVETMKLGALDFIQKPVAASEIANRIVEFLNARITSGSERPILTESPHMAQLLRHAKKVASLDSPVLILGESGTGKELFARFIHEHSARNVEQFVPVNCGSVPHELLESEFFGHEAGSFTGAGAERAGLFEVASKGTIFLDEIGNMPQALQIKLLRTLQEKEIRRVGSTKTRKVDVRVVSATNCNLDEEMKRGTFREDLYYRLGVVVLNIPPLRERPEDVAPLARHFLGRYAAQFGKEGTILTPDAIQLLENHTWPGNVRELENVIQRSLIFAEGKLTAASFQLRLLHDYEPFPAKSLHEISSAATRRAEISAISATLSQTQGNKMRAAEILGISYKTLLNKVKEYGIDARSEALQ